VGGLGIGIGIARATFSLDGFIQMIYIKNEAEAKRHVANVDKAGLK
jgi:hypothetical protein